MMTPLQTSRRTTGRNPRREGGYVFVLVLALIGVAAISAGAALERASMQSHLAQMQVEGYEHYHDLQGAKSIAQLYLFRQDQRSLLEVANTGEAVRSIRFGIDAGNMVVNIYVQDGQGTLLRHLGDVPEGDPVRFLHAALGRLPTDRLDLTRTGGPWQVSINGAPDEVLEAIAGGDAETADALNEFRDQGLRSAADLQRLFNQEGIEPTLAQAIGANLAFAPTLWRIDIEVVRVEERSQYVVFATTRDSIPRLLQWRTLDDPRDVAGFGPGAGHHPRSNVARAGSNRRNP